MRYLEEPVQADVIMDAVIEDPVQEDGIELCEDFLQRVKRLPTSNTLVHTAFSQRISTCELLASTLDAALDGGRAHNILAQSVPKLIFSMPPKGFNNAQEMKLRLNMWNDRRYNDLLERIEAQFFERQQSRRKRQASNRRSPTAEQGRRACNIAAENAFNKAVAPLTNDEEKKWASTLLPTSTRPDRVLARTSGTVQTGLSPPGNTASRC